MKKIFIALSAIAFLYACSDENSTESINSEKSLLNTVNSDQSCPAVNSLGTLHNTGLHYLINNNDFTPDSPRDYVIDKSINILNNFHYPSDIFKRIGQDSVDVSKGMKEALDNDYYYDIEKLNEAVVYRDFLTPTAKSQILSIQETFNIASQNNDINYLNDRINYHISVYESTNWTNNEGDLVGGYLYVAKGSTQYWTTTSAVFTAAILTIIQVDAAGYLWGWTKAAFIDKYPNEECRIAAGMAMAVEASFFGMVDRKK